MQVTVLGCGTSTGVPVIACPCAVCHSNNPKNNRTRSSLLIRTDSGKNIVVDTGPEFRIQALRESLTSLDAVLYTHLHADHCHGFDDVRAFRFLDRRPISCYMARDFQEEFRQRFAYAFTDLGYAGTRPEVDMYEIPDDGIFTVGGQEVESFRVAHGVVQTSVFRFESFAYATDYKAFTEEQIERWRGKVRVMISSGIHFRDHPSHSTIPQTLALFEKLEVEHGIISHLSHEVDFERDRSKLPAHVEFAYDGMKLSIS